MYRPGESKKCLAKRLEGSVIKSMWPIFTGVEKIADHGTNGPRNFSGLQKK